MRSLIVLTCLIAFASAGPREDFCKKLRNEIGVVFWSEANLCKIADMVIEDVRKGLTMEQIGEKGLKYVTPNTPLLDYSKLLGMMTSMDKCLKGTNTKTFDVIGLAMPVIMNNIKGPYGVIRDKMKKMQANKKSVKDQTTEAYKLAKSSITKPLAQKMISNSSKKMNDQQWKCSVANLPKIIALGKYDTKKYK